LKGYHRAMTPRLADDELTAFLDDFNARQIPSAAETGAAALRVAAAERAAARAKGPELSAVRDLHVPSDGRAARLYPMPWALGIWAFVGGSRFWLRWVVPGCGHAESRRVVPGAAGSTGRRVSGRAWL